MYSFRVPVSVCFDSHKNWHSYQQKANRCASNFPQFNFFYIRRLFPILWTTLSIFKNLCGFLWLSLCFFSNVSCLMYPIDHVLSSIWPTFQSSFLPLLFFLSHNGTVKFFIYERISWDHQHPYRHIFDCSLAAAWAVCRQLADGRVRRKSRCTRFQLPERSCGPRTPKPLSLPLCADAPSPTISHLCIPPLVMSITYSDDTCLMQFSPFSCFFFW